MQRQVDEPWVRCTLAPLKTQFASSVAANASTSRTVSHSGLVGRVALERRAPPQSSHLLVVLPEVVDDPVPNGAVWDPVPRRGDLERSGMKAVEPRIGLEVGERAIVLRAHPGESVVSLDLFEPAMEIV